MTAKQPKIRMYAFTIDCKAPLALAQFYAKLMDWPVVYSDETWACVGAPGLQQGAYPGIMFQGNADYEPPVWPQAAGRQQQMAHLDFAVDDLPAAVQHALDCGAVQAPAQFSEGWRVMLDPEGHPFCLCAMGEMMAGESFALR